MIFSFPGIRKLGFAILIAVGFVISSFPSVWAQAPAPTAPEADPSRETKPSPSDSKPDDPDDTAKQIRQLIEMNKKLSSQLDDLSKKYDDLSKKVEGPPGRSESEKETYKRTGKTTGTGDVLISEEAGGGSGGGVRSQDKSQVVGNRHLGKIRLYSSYDYNRDGFVFETEDTEFQLKIRTLFQGDARIYEQMNQKPVSSGFTIPRARWYFSGRMTKAVEYQLSIQNGFDNLALLNAFITYNIDERLQFRVGRYKTPYTYEYYRIPVQDLLAPERSIFNVNFQGNRQVGLMASGQLLDKKLEYAVGVFDGRRNSYGPSFEGKDVMAFLNFKPFLGNDTPLEHLNIGGSLDYGYENSSSLSPAVLRTNSQASGDTITVNSANNSSSVPFLAFNSNVKELGVREQWELHAAYYYKALALLGAWDSGFNSWALTTQGAAPVGVPSGGYFVQAAYLLTGETRTDVGLIDPLHPFNLKAGEFGLGAFELTSRFSTVNLGKNVFQAGFADPNLWTNSVNMTDAGFNWYLNKYTKIYFDWEQSIFGQPVYYRPGHLQKTSDLFWFRFQLYF